jgi:putative transcriptional regulator
LEQEMGTNAWLSGPADGDILFRLPAGRRWLAAASLIGVDLNLMSAEVGHA